MSLRRAGGGLEMAPPRARARRAGAAMEVGPIVTSKQREEVVHGVPTEVVCTAFSNSILVVVTQYGKMGTIVYVDPNTISDNVGRPSLTTKVLLGKDESCSRSANFTLSLSPISTGSQRAPCHCRTILS
ncbi:proteasome assembly chaperone 3 isoform X2 [Mycteria americana]|uniref:proteasome assembly chaperone 3 isoform X2 n=1 Tax=Mycteria americana TaxID=33587 RepID=UPI003F5859DE